MDRNPDKNKKPKPPGADKPSNNRGFMNILIIGLAITAGVYFINGILSAEPEVEITYSQFVQLVDLNAVESVEINDVRLEIHLRTVGDVAAIQDVLGVAPGKDDIYVTGIIDDPKLSERLLEHHVKFSRPIVDNNPMVSFVLGWVILPLVLMFLFYSLFIRSFAKRMGGEGGGGGGFGGFMNVGKSKAKMYNMEKTTGVLFTDVAGQDEAKESLSEMVDFLNNPEKYREIGAKQPKGALLVGPPGTGKTLLAKAVAGEAGVAFFSLSGSEFVEMYVGVGASRVRDLFEQAKKHSPCIVFIDEIDAIGKSRDNQIGGNDEREQTLNQLLSEMDGFDSTKTVVILAATNRPEILDKALLRPGRFDRRIAVEKPDLTGRESILIVHAAKVKMDDSVDLREIALMTSGAAGADLANMINEAALHAVRMGRQEVSQADLMEAVETVIAGKEKKDRILNPKEKRLVAYHEVGHALAAALQKESMPVQKITIVPRTMGSLGYTMQTPEEETYLMSKAAMETQITTLLAGRAAEEVEFNEMTTGAANDIERATKMARSMVTQYGMSGRFGMMGLESPQNQYLDGRNVLMCSEATGSDIDREVRDFLKQQYDRAVELLQENREALTRISEFLIEKETITGAQFMRLLEGEDVSSAKVVEDEAGGKPLGEIDPSSWGIIRTHEEESSHESYRV
ncbi:MAG: ATP-dependent zinc metalloprotease FtsH [Peptococcaceae bacterium]|nr:ATP-dependent zinc metalloprotease FtsH [Peptococcaceae bacterium]